MRYYTNHELLDIFAEANQKIEERKFGRKLEIIETLQWALLHSEQFQKDIEKVRTKFSIPNDLDVISDSFIFSFEDKRKRKTVSSPSHSAFWDWRGLAREEAFDKAIQNLIASYEHIPPLLFHWVRDFIVYNQGTDPLHLEGLSFLNYAIKNRKTISKLPLNTAEKKNLLSILRTNLGKSNGRSGRPKKENAKIYKELSNLFNSSEKSKFRLGFTDKEKKVFEMKKSGKTYPQIVKELYPEKIAVIDEINSIKQLYRDVNKRLNELTKKVEN